MSSPAAPLDFEALLSRNYRPARVTHLIPQPPREDPITHQPAGGSDGKKQQHAVAGANSLSKKQKKADNHDNEDDEIREEKISQLALKLVSYTPAYARHVAPHQKSHSAHIIPDEAIKSGGHHHDASDLPPAPVDEWKTLPPSLHQVELSDWEKSINWEGASKDEVKQEGNNNGKTKPAVVSSAIVPKSSPLSNYNIDASSLLSQKRNPYLDALVLDSSNICWSGASDDAMEKARRVPLILDMGTAGSSVVRQSLPSTRPMPMGQSTVYLDRLEKEWSNPSVSTANVTGRLHADKDAYEQIVKAKEKKRERMAIDKKERIHKSMGTLELGGGKGRTITSSLMGPGGTERTGRPSRQVGLSAHDTEYIEQLELVYNHVLVKPDLRKVELRQYHRPRLPRTVVRSDMHWQFQVRASSSSAKKTDSSSAVSSSYQQMMMGAHAGSLSEAKIRNEADLSPSEGKLVVLEYSEERPPLQLTKGMASKIINYYRGDKSRCPVSAGGGDRPTRRKQHGEKANQGESNNNMGKSSGKLERPPRLVGPNQTLTTSITDWIGKPPKKSRESEKEKSTVNVLPEGVTEMLHPKVHGPFIGEVEEDTTQSGLITNLFAAPIFRHEPESSDFLMILGKMPGGVERPGVKDSLGVVLRPMPANVFTVGQTEPRTKVFAPNATGEKNFYDPFQCYHIAKALTRAAEQKDEGGLGFDEINNGLFAYTKQQSTALRSRIKKVAKFDKNTQIWTPKYIGEEDYPGVEALGRKFLPEGVAAYETACAAARRLCDLGIHDLFSGSNGIANVTAAMAQLTGQLNATKERKSKLNKMLNHAKTVKGSKPTQIALYEKAASATEVDWKDIRRKHEVARFITEELCLAPWHLTVEFIEVHKNGQGSGMMKLTGLGDPSGIGEGFNFIREVDTKPNKSTGNTDGALSAQIKKITGTENDLRKLTMKQMASLLRSYGMQQSDIDTLKRWDRVHVIRDFSTKAASDGMGDGLERFARGEKMKLSEQKKMYQDRIQLIWRRQRIGLSTDAGDIRPAAQSLTVGASSVNGGDSMAANVATESGKQAEKEKEESDSDDEEDEELAAMFEKEFEDVKKTNQLVADQINNGGDTSGTYSKQRREDAEQMSKDAREFAALQRERQEQLAAEAGLSATPGVSKPAGGGMSMIGRKIIRRRVTKTHPDGRQETIFKFILEPTEVNKILTKKKKSNAENKNDKKKKGDGHTHYRPDRRIIGHSMFEEDDGVDHSKGRTHLSFQVETKTRAIKKKGGQAKQRNRHLQLGKLKEKVSVSQEKRNQKRKRAAEDADLYTASYKRKGTSNRRERGSARERKAHVILADRLEQIRSLVEKRPGSGPFHRPVNRRMIPSYYEKISNPIDLQTIRDKNQRYEYKTTETFLRDFDLMRSNAVKFNGLGSVLSDEATNIYNVVKETVENNQAELTAMADAVREQMSSKKKKKKTKATTKKKSPSKAAAAAGAIVTEDGVAVNLGNLTTDFTLPDSDSDDSFAAGLASGLMKSG